MFNKEIKMLIASLISAIIVVFLFSSIGWYNVNSNTLIFFTMTNYISLKIVEYYTNKK